MNIMKNVVKEFQKPNVIIVLTDDQGYGDLGCTGNPILKTPRIDKLFEESIRFTDFHVAPMCTPTRGQLMTGMDALSNGAYHVCSGRTFVRKDIMTMAEYFSSNGYRTGHFGKWHLGDNYPYRPQDRGFQETLCHNGGMIGAASDYWNNDYFDDWYVHNGEKKQYKGYCTDIWFGEAMKWIRKCAGEGVPFFAYICPNAPHVPLFVPESYRRPYLEQGLDENLGRYFGMIANIDENIGKLDDMLSETGLAGNTIFIFLSDNGGKTAVDFYNAGMRGKKCSLYEGGHRVPCFVRWPDGNLRNPCDIDELTHVQDLLPTLIDFCDLQGLPEDVNFDGISLEGLLRGNTDRLPERTLVIQYSYLPHDMDPEKWDSCVLRGKWRLIGGTELYNVGNDIGQENNIAGQNPEIVDILRRDYEKWWDRVSPLIRDFSYISIGNNVGEEICLSSIDWLYAHASVQSAHIRKGVKDNGPWNIYIEQNGIYRIELRRWPKEANVEMSNGVPPYRGEDGIYPEGKALLVSKVRLSIQDFVDEQPVQEEDTAIVFYAPLKRGKTKMTTWLFDSEGELLCGAYYTYVTLIDKKERS